MTCLMCPRQTKDRDCCHSCEFLLVGDRLLRDAYRARGGTFAGLTASPVFGRSWRHGTVNGYRRHACRCLPCVEAMRMDNRRTHHRQRERRAAA